MSLTTGEDKSVTLGAARFRVCIEAAWELEALALTLPKVTSNSDEEATQSSLVVRGIAARIKSLSGVLMSGLHDETETTAALECVVMVSLTLRG